MKNRPATDFKTVRHIARSAQQTIKNTTGVNMSLMLCPTDIMLKTPERMLYKIATALGMNFKSYKKKTRERDVVELRFLGAYFIRMHFPEITLQQIAALYGGQDHSSIISGIARAHNLLYTSDQRFLEKYITASKAIEQWLKNEIAMYSFAATA